jgi:ankyrin repeat protein
MSSLDERIKILRNTLASVTRENKHAHEDYKYIVDTMLNNEQNESIRLPLGLRLKELQDRINETETTMKRLEGSIMYLEQARQATLEQRERMIALIPRIETIRKRLNNDLQEQRINNQISEEERNDRINIYRRNITDFELSIENNNLENIIQIVENYENIFRQEDIHRNRIINSNSVIEKELMYAIISNNLERVSFILLHHHDDININFNKGAALIKAVELGNIPIIRILLHYDADRIFLTKHHLSLPQIILDEEKEIKEKREANKIILKERDAKLKESEVERRHREAKQHEEALKSTPECQFCLDKLVDHITECCNNAVHYECVKNLSKCPYCRISPIKTMPLDEAKKKGISIHYQQLGGMESTLIRAYLIYKSKF